MAWKVHAKNTLFGAGRDCGVLSLKVIAKESEPE